MHKTIPFLRIALGLLLLSLLLAACLSSESAPTAAPSGTPVAGVADGLLRDQAQVQQVDIFLLESFPVQVRVQVSGVLPDACTGIETISSERQDTTFLITLTSVRPADAACAAVETPFTESVPLDVVGLPAGVYLVVVNGVRSSFQFQVDNVASAASPPLPSDTIGSGPSPVDATPAVAAAASDLARQLGLEAGAIDVVSAEPMTWPDGCLGLALPGEACLQAITPGFRVAVQADGRTYFYRSDESGQILRQEVSPVAPDLTPAPACSNRAEFVRDVTVRDNTRIQPGEAFTKTWRLRNAGTCTWTTAYALVFDSGDQLSGPDVAVFPAAVPPGRTVDLSASMIAPLQKGLYKGLWKLRSADGQTFGIGPRSQAFWVLITVPVTVTPTPASSGASIRGQAWHDLCTPAAHGAPAPTTPPPGCVVAADGSFIADGIFAPGEPHIAGMEVSLGQGPCPAAALRTTIADAAGFYSFDNLDAGVYCVFIDTLSPHNLPIFIPGAWTYPPGGIGEQSVSVGAAAVVEGVDFGWDYQFAP